MTSVRHVGIVVSNMEVSLSFYCDLLGLHTADVVAESGPFLDGLLGMDKARIRTAKLAGSDGPTLVELLLFDQPEPTEATPLTAIGPTHVALNVSDLDQIYQRMIEAGINFNAPPALSPDGGAKVAFCQDPDGTFIELVEPQK
ncbi:MAG: VOC family protein [Rhodospirillaceae bacterium]|jgi:catechol 2,3-dioxygenase-like lactoylglutathione lyase family enzyme|nr:VOC family protein [Rhodospirillaceae bacterium]MBT5245526.1 VOC family protein [Rhodospirillaceae bacterium]MBT5561008.1 VOC family protein [Rhodospirillaceae bacterium]MBT6240644.1 VOC family protein [Rhodospirillaceae bacterium]